MSMNNAATFKPLLGLALGITAVTSFLFVSCDLVDLHRLEVETDPSSANEIIATDSHIAASFSRPVDRESAEQAFRIESSTGQVDVDFVWSDDGFQAVPVERLNPGLRYELRVEGTVIDYRDLEHNVDTYVPFFYGTDSIRPSLVSSTPESGGDTGVFDPIRLYFSEPVDPESAAEAISVSPETDVEITWHNEDTVAEVAPTEQWDPLTVYQWSVSDDGHSAHGVPLAAERSGSFVTQYDRSAPDLEDFQFAIRKEGIVLETSEFRTDGVIVLRFSEAVRFDSVRHAVTVSPTVLSAMEQLSETEFLLRFDEVLEAESAIKITVPDSIRDLSGNHLVAERSIVVEPVAARQRVSGIRSFWGDPEGGAGVTLALDADLDETTEVGIGQTDGTNTVQFEFDYPYISKDARDRLIDAVELRALLPERAVSPDREQIRWLDEGSRLRISFAGFIPSASPGKPSIYRLRIPAGAASAPDEAEGLEYPLTVYLRTEPEQ